MELIVQNPRSNVQTLSADHLYINAKMIESLFTEPKEPRIDSDTLINFDKLPKNIDEVYTLDEANEKVYREHIDSIHWKIETSTPWPRKQKKRIQKNVYKKVV